jgi:hypothetical protein
MHGLAGLFGLDYWRITWADKKSRNFGAQHRARSTQRALSRRSVQHGRRPDLVIEVLQWRAGVFSGVSEQRTDVVPPTGPEVRLQSTSFVLPTTSTRYRASCDNDFQYSIRHLHPQRPSIPRNQSVRPEYPAVLSPSQLPICIVPPIACLTRGPVDIATLSSSSSWDLRDNSVS